MWSPSAPLIRVGLSQQQVSIARLPRFGLGLNMGLSLGRQQAVEHLPCPAQTGGTQHEPWRSAVDTLAQWLATNKLKRLQVQLVLSGRWIRWQLMPWRPELNGATERTAYAALRFRETFGAQAQHWQVLPSSRAPGLAAPAAAVDAALLEALQAVCGEAGTQLHSITPYFSSAFDNWRGSLKGTVVWFGTVEADTLSLGLLKDGHWLALQTQRVASDWREALRALMAHMALACDVPQDGAGLYLAGDIPEPASQTAMPFTWLSPRPLRAPAPSGLRLVMGC